MTDGRSPAPGAGGGLVDDLEADGDLVGVDLDEVRARRAPTELRVLRAEGWRRGGRCAGADGRAG